MEFDFQMNMDIGAVVSQRLKAMRRLAENPHDSEAQIQMYHAQKKVSDMTRWIEGDIVDIHI